MTSTTILTELRDYGTEDKFEWEEKKSTLDQWEDLHVVVVLRKPCLDHL